MYFENILNEKILTIKSIYDINSIFNYEFQNNILYKISYIKKYEGELINEFELNNSYFSDDSSKYPENALKIELKRGTYRLSIINGGLFNTETKELNNCIMSSKGILNFSKLINLSDDEKNIINQENLTTILNNHFNDLYVNNYFDFKISSASKFHIWVNNENVIGNLSFKIHKIDKKENSNESTTLVFDSNTLPVCHFDINYMYDIYLYKFINEDFIEPKIKYPSGTYQIILNDEIAETTNIDDLIQLQSNNKKQFNFDLNGKLLSLDNISIPNDVNPLNFYFMLGKCEIICYIDFISDTYHFYPISYAECFMNLFLPESKIEKIEESPYYVKFKITEYQHISYNFNNPDEIMNNFSKWLNINKSDIYYDEYKLYFYTKSYDLYNTYLSKIIPSYIDFDEYFTYIELNVSCKVYDDVSIKIEDEEYLLNYEVTNYKEDENFNPISGALWKVIDEKPSNFNYINWTNPENWENTKRENILMSYINGKGYLKISKQRFKNLFNVDLDWIKSGNFTDEDFKKLKLNNPIISPYERFQYWMNLKV
jgi:hypothetical protein